MRVQALCLLLSSCVVACGALVDDEQQDRCDDVTAQIEEAFQENIENGVLLPGSIACELTPESFDPRVPPPSMEYLRNAFSRACDEQALCAGISTEVGPPPGVSPPIHGAEPATTR
jgi:hypothetical protein